MKSAILLLIAFLNCMNSRCQVMTSEEQALFDLIMNYRKTKNLPSIPFSPSLTIVAQTHAKDLAENNPDQGRCNLHSWSGKGNWSQCCYTDDHAKAQCMWNKPSELTSYSGNGYEISAWSSEDITAEEALSMWKSSPGHHACVINSGIWKQPWQAMGVGIYQGYALVWFGNEVDPLSQSRKK
ncbi:MAG: CAP domain-containing protein [Flavobacteriales bacterium]